MCCPAGLTGHTLGLPEQTHVPYMDIQQPSRASYGGAAGLQTHFMSLHRQTEALSACADFETAAGRDRAIPLPVVKLVRHVYAREVGTAGSGACTGLTRNQVSWAWAVVSPCNSLRGWDNKSSAAPPQSLLSDSGCGCRRSGLSVATQGSRSTGALPSSSCVRRCWACASNQRHSLSGRRCRGFRRGGRGTEQQRGRERGEPDSSIPEEHSRNNAYAESDSEPL